MNKCYRKAIYKKIGIVLFLVFFSGCGLHEYDEADDIEKAFDESIEFEENQQEQVDLLTKRVFDEADVLSDDEEVALEEYVGKAEEKTLSDIVIVTLNKSLKEYALGYQADYNRLITENRYVMVYADNFWIENNFGYRDSANEEHGNGVILVDNLYREVGTGKFYTWLGTNGEVADRLSNSDINDILDTFYEKVDTDYYQACINFVDAFVESMSASGNNTEKSAETEQITSTFSRNPSDSKDVGRTYSDDRVADLDSILASADINNVKAVNYDITSYDGRWTYNVGYNYNCDIYNYYHTLNRYYDSLDYNRYVFDEGSVEYVKQIVNDLDELYDTMNYSESDKVREIVNFVQSIAYVSDKEASGRDEWPKYAVETLYEQNGDCEDLSILLAGMLMEKDYGCCLIVFDDHVAVGLLGDDTMPGAYYEIAGKKYFYVETTERGWGIGEVPDQYNGVSANIIPIR